MRSKLYKIISFFGLTNQKRKFMEESMELFEAITEFQMKCRELEGRPADYVDSVLETYRMHIVEELADNFVMLGQFIDWFNIDQDLIAEMGARKIDRTLERYGIDGGEKHASTRKH